MATYVSISDAEVAPEAPVTTSLMTRLRDNALAYAGAPTGTRALWQQTSAPLGWTKDTSHNNKALRLTSGTVGSGGSVGFSTLFGRTATDSFTISQANLPNVNFVVAAGQTVSVTGTLSRLAGNAGAGSTGLSIAANAIEGLNMTSTGMVTSTGTAASGGSGTSMTAAIDMRVSYVDFIIAAKA